MAIIERALHLQEVMMERRRRRRRRRTSRKNNQERYDCRVAQTAHG